MVQHFDGVQPLIGTHVEANHIILLPFGFSRGAIPLILEFGGLHMDLWHVGDYFFLFWRWAHSLGYTHEKLVEDDHFIIVDTLRAHF